MEFGPFVSEHLKTQNAEVDKHRDEQEKTVDNASPDKDFFGPKLPPNLMNRSVIGPSLPLKYPTEKNALCEEILEQDIIGPQLPCLNEDDSFITRCKADIEARAKEKKLKLTTHDDNKDGEIVREEWMTQLPPELGKNFGLGARKFRSKEVNVGDRSVWTNTPSQSGKKGNSNQMKPLVQNSEAKKRQHDIEKYVCEHNKQYRSESLLDLHQKNRKKEKKNKKKLERRPFDRDVDMGTTQMNPTHRKSLVKHSTDFNFKFEHSKQDPSYL
ncbi:GPALPP motifs-containing protein 1-like [Xenia sp. Carnegie-2017]|uniref:GPALPP motifs-containing protein 1-like n=1 Tax=Xenia sp. Carnegie-2017 TaxID=2897299 RepID=UPI001F04873D|nr:GPALPP motifs-containing protein 1-like [Xenia sp. Carnegie-2017]